MTIVRYHEAAEHELLAEIGYLELRQQGLGSLFLRLLTTVVGQATGPDVSVAETARAE